MHHRNSPPATNPAPPVIKTEPGVEDVSESIPLTQAPGTAEPEPPGASPPAPAPAPLSAAPSWSVPSLLDLFPTVSTHPPMDDQPARLLLNMLSWTSATLIRGTEDALCPGSRPPSHDGAPRISHGGSVESDWLTSALGRLARQPSTAALPEPLRSLSNLSAFLEDDSLWGSLTANARGSGLGTAPISEGMGTSAPTINSFTPSSLAAAVAATPALQTNPFALQGGRRGEWGPPCLLVPSSALLCYDPAAWGGGAGASCVY